MAEYRSGISISSSNAEAGRTHAVNFDVDLNSIRPRPRSTLEPTSREIQPFRITGVGYSSEGNRSINRNHSKLAFSERIQQQCSDDVGKEREQYCQIRLGLHLDQTKSKTTNVRSLPTGAPHVNVRPESGISRTADQTRNAGITGRTTHISKQSQKSSTLSPVCERNRKPPIGRPGQLRATMSRSSVNNYGRVSNPARPVGISRGSDQSDPGDAQLQASNNSSSSSENRNAQRHGSYTVIPPDPKKRSKISSQAEREANAFQSYKESQRVNYVKTVPQLVGGKKSEEEVQRQRQKELNESRYRTQMKRRQWEAEKKEREEAEYRAKKEKAREQANRNRARKSERQDTWTEDHKRTNELFLRKLEQKSYQK